MTLECSAGCEVTARLTRRGRVVARGSLSRLRAGEVTLRLRALRSVRRRLRAGAYTLRLTVADRHGTTRTLTRSLRLR